MGRAVALLLLAVLLPSARAQEPNLLTAEVIKHTQCRVVKTAYADASVKVALTSASFKINTVYYVMMDSRHVYQNGVESEITGQMYAGFCEDGTLMSFVYTGSELVCDFAVVKSGGKAAQCYECLHYKQHHGTPHELMTSTDGCYSYNYSDPYQVSLRVFWQDYFDGDLTPPSERFLYDPDTPHDVADCLKSYVGIRMPESTGYCARSLGGMCFKGYCVSPQKMPSGYTNQPFSTQVDTNMKLQCRIDSNLKPQDLSKLRLCDVCVIEYLTIVSNLVTVPSIYKEPRLHHVCNEVVLAVGNTVPMTDAAVKLIMNWMTTNSVSNRLHGIEIPWVLGSNVLIESLNTALAVFRYISISVRYNLGDMNIDAFVRELSNSPTVARQHISYVTLIQSTRQTFEKEGKKALAALLMYRRPMTVFYVVPFTSAASLESDLAAILSVRTVHLGAYNILTENVPNHKYMTMLRSAVLGTQSVDNNGVVDTNLLRSMSYYYYITTVRQLNYCPYVASYYNNVMMLKFPYRNTVRVPGSDVYWAEPEFSCSVGNVNNVPYVETCVFEKNTVPSVGISIVKLIEEAYVPGQPYLMKNLTCAYMEQRNGASCTFSETRKTVTNTLYLANGRVTQKVTDMGTYHVATLMTAKIINDMVDVIEIIPLEKTCTFLNISLLPNCEQAVCGQSVGETPTAACDAKDACSMDPMVRGAMGSLFEEFEYAKRRYKETIAVAETWQVSREPVRQKRFAGIIVAGMAVTFSLAAIGIAGTALYYAKQSDAKATQALNVAMQTRNVLLQVAEQTEGIKTSIAETNNRVDKAEASIKKIGDTMFKITNTLQAKLAETNSRISDLTAHVDRNFALVQSAINTISTKLAKTMEMNQKAALYYQQMFAFQTMVVQGTARLIQETQMYSTCLQNIDSGRLYGCPLSDPFINVNADYRMVSSVYGAIYDGQYLNVVYKVPSSVELMTLYSVLIKPFEVNGVLQVVESAQVVMGPDGGFYKKPYCEGRYCMPLEQDTNFSKCLSMVQSGNTEQIARFCTVTPCNKADCSDKMNIQTLKGVVEVEGVALTEFKVQSVNFINYRQANLTLDKASDFVANASYDKVLETALADVLSTIVNNTNSSRALKVLIQEELDKVKPQEWIKQLNDPMYNYPIGGISGTTTAIIVMSCVLGITLVGLALYAYCRYKTNLAKLGGGRNAYSPNAQGFPIMSYPQGLQYQQPPVNPPPYNPAFKIKDMLMEDPGIGFPVGGGNKMSLIQKLAVGKKFNTGYRYKKV